MSPNQILKQLKYKAENLTWTGGGVVFGAVHATLFAPADAFEDGVRFPICFVGDGSAVPDPELPDLLTYNPQVSIVVQGAGDRLGQNSLIGGNRSSGATSSKGRGLLEVGEVFLSMVERMLREDGIRIVATPTNHQQGFPEDQLGYVAAKIYSIEAECTRFDYYHPPVRFRAVNAGSGNATLTWIDPPDRFDRRTQVMIRRAAGATAPADETSGTEVANVNIGTQSYTDSPGAGQFSYAAFMPYTDSGAAANESWSDQEDGTTSTVTVTS